MAATAPQQPTTVVQKLAALNEQTWLTMGNLAELVADYDKAMTCYESALRHNPYSVITLTQIASLCRGREQFGRAVENFKRILAIQENHGETWAALGHCYLMMENLQDAYNAYQQALYHLSNPKDPKLWYGIGILYDRYGSLEHAEEAFSAVMKMDPKFEKANEIYFRLGIIYKQQQKFDLSLQCFRYILHSPPRPLTESDIWFQTGHVYEQQKEYELAKEAYERVLSENPDHAKVLQQLGWLYHQQITSFCNQTLAIEYLTRSLKSDSNDAQSWYLLGRCYMAEQNYNKAYEAYQQAVYRDDRNPTFWCSIGVLYYQINQYRDALDAYSRAIRLNPYISEVWYDLGTLYESCNNQVQDALEAYQHAAELDPSNPHIKQRLELLRKSQSSQSSGAAPTPQDVQNPGQYQNGSSLHSLNGASYSQSAPSGPPSSMAAYHAASRTSQRPGDERTPTPRLARTRNEGANEPARDLPMLGGSLNHRSPGPYSPRAPQHRRVPDADARRSMTPSERLQLNPALHDEARQRGLSAHQNGSPFDRANSSSSVPPLSYPKPATADDDRMHLSPSQRPSSRGPPHHRSYDSPMQHYPSPHVAPAYSSSPRSAPPASEDSLSTLYNKRAAVEPDSSAHTPTPKAEEPSNDRDSPPVQENPIEKKTETSPKGPASIAPVTEPQQESGENANYVEARKPARKIDEDYDETTADTLLSIGKRSHSPEPKEEDNKKPKFKNQDQPVSAETNSELMDEDSKSTKNDE
ncbi:glucose repression mediator protein [Apophysomyces sp. BC1034]|nr:glucose repression mediator protein [Apophysomyces sp. BC1015]KAG0176259.1 glucose repression mediator protein [Apophysomyces sp. BC1021]KAG0191308.1 glucose repression mediator protein [Apophysomyces sp. BC1034]